LGGGFGDLGIGGNGSRSFGDRNLLTFNLFNRICASSKFLRSSGQMTLCDNGLRSKPPCCNRLLDCFGVGVSNEDVFLGCIRLTKLAITADAFFLYSSSDTIFGAPSTDAGGRENEIVTGFKPVSTGLTLRGLSLWSRIS